MAFPATSETEGYTAEKKKGNVLSVPAHGSWRVDMRLGALTKAETADAIREIETVRAG